MHSRRYPSLLCGTLLGAPWAKCTPHQHYSMEHYIPHNVLQSQYPTALFPHRTNMNYATPHAFNVGYNNEQKHGHTVKGGAVAVSLAMSKRENNPNPGVVYMNGAFHATSHCRKL